MSDIDHAAAAERVNEMIGEPAEATVDGRSARNQPIPDVLKVIDRGATSSALAGPNANGGPKSGWKRLRMARAVSRGMTE